MANKEHPIVYEVVMKNTPIAFIGGGHMTYSLVGGLISSGYNPNKIWVAEPDCSRKLFLRSCYNSINIDSDHLKLAAQSEVIFLAIKPHIMQEVTENLVSVIQSRQPLVISIAAGIRESDLRCWLGGGKLALVRAMPNTSAFVRCSASALFANKFVSEKHRKLVESILQAVGVTIWVEDEMLLDAVTALSGSGPAYFFLLMEALEQASINLGLDPCQARLLTQHTAFGAAKMVIDSAESPAALLARVVSPGGTTEQALEILREGGFEKLVALALEKAYQRARELGNLLRGDQ
jgi:pyrroline-5-carboxylate reductase